MEPDSTLENPETPLPKIWELRHHQRIPGQMPTGEQPIVVKRYASRQLDVTIVFRTNNRETEAEITKFQVDAKKIFVDKVKETLTADPRILPLCRARKQLAMMRDRLAKAQRAAEQSQDAMRSAASSGDVDAHREAHGTHAADLAFLDSVRLEVDRLQREVATLQTAGKRCVTDAAHEATKFMKAMLTAHTENTIQKLNDKCADQIAGLAAAELVRKDLFSGVAAERIELAGVLDAVDPADDGQYERPLESAA